MAQAEDPIAASLLRYALMALDLDIALGRMLEAAALQESDLAVLDRTKELLDFAREGQRLFQEPVLTHNAVAAMTVYETFVRSGTVLEEMPNNQREAVLDAVATLVDEVKGAQSGHVLAQEQAEAAKHLRLFFGAFRNDALTATSRPMERVNLPELQFGATASA